MGIEDAADAIVERTDGAVMGLYANAQPGYAEEWLADDAEVIAFLNPAITIGWPAVQTYLAPANKA